MKRIAVFPGSFDPVTKGHEDIVLRALPLFDEIIIAVGENTSKNAFFDTRSKINLINKSFANIDKVSISVFSGSTVNFCKQKKANFLLRGVRNTTDFEYEKSIALTNKKIANIETIILFASPELEFINSRIIRELIKVNEDVSNFLPSFINNEDLKK